MSVGKTEKYGIRPAAWKKAGCAYRWDYLQSAQVGLAHEYKVIRFDALTGILRMKTPEGSRCRKLFEPISNTEGTSRRVSRSILGPKTPLICLSIRYSDWRKAIHSFESDVCRPYFTSAHMQSFVRSDPRYSHLSALKTDCLFVSLASSRLNKTWFDVIWFDPADAPWTARRKKKLVVPELATVNILCSQLCASVKPEGANERTWGVNLQYLIYDTIQF